MNERPADEDAPPVAEEEALDQEADFLPPVTMEDQVATLNAQLEDSSRELEEMRASLQRAQADFVKARRPRQKLTKPVSFEVPFPLHVIQKIERGFLDPMSLVLVELKLMHKATNRPVSDVLVLESTHEVVQKTLSKSSGRRFHPI